jgi:glycosyltransferase involved in cell wall biosynthesis
VSRVIPPYDSPRWRDNEPLVTIGIPAYDRPWQLERAVRSALAQDHRAIEVLVSDDASSNPAVRQLGASLAATDSRLDFVRQPSNVGHAANYQWLLEAAHGDYFMWLSDDDWIDPEYVARCLAVLLEDSSTRVVCGLARYYRGASYVLDERSINLDCRRPGRRLIRYFSRVSLNGPLFGVARREDLLAVGFPQVAGGDWLLIAALAAGGRVLTVPGVHIHRSLDGLGADPDRLASSFGMRGLPARQHHVVLARRVWMEITFGAAAFDGMTRITRVWVATVAAALILVRFTLAELVRGVIGDRAADWLERRTSEWLRRRDVRAHPSGRAGRHH